MKAEDRPVFLFTTLRKTITTAMCLILATVGLIFLFTAASNPPNPTMSIVLKESISYSK